jgi:hypothetical protein
LLWRIFTKIILHFSLQSNAPDDLRKPRIAAQRIQSGFASDIGNL